MIFRFFSGSASPANAVKNRCSASTRITLNAHVLCECRHHLIAFAQTQQPMIDEYAGQLSTDGLVQERRQHGRINSARQAQQHAVASNLRADPRHAVIDDVACRPTGGAAGNLSHEAPQYLAALKRVSNLG